MTQLEFTNILNHPEKINALLTDKLEKVIKVYPYFQSARILYLKGLQNQKSFKFNNTLKKTAAYVSDRSVLFDYIITKKETSYNNDKTDILELHKKISNDKVKSVKDALQIGQPFSFNISEKHSFNEWLKLSQQNTVIQQNSKNLKFNLIDKFIKNKPKIKPTHDKENKSIISQGIQENSDIMTETLASVYLEQKKYEKAITAYTILSLKYPEKSSFFANRIKAVKFLQKNNN